MNDEEKKFIEERRAEFMKIDVNQNGKIEFNELKVSSLKL